MVRLRLVASDALESVAVQVHVSLYDWPCPTVPRQEVVALVGLVGVNRVFPLPA